MTEFCLINVPTKDGDTDGYINFNPHNNSYFISKGKVGACGFKKEDALNFISAIGLQNYKLETINLTNVNKTTIKRGGQVKKIFSINNIDFQLKIKLIF